VDAEGRETTDPNQAAALLPFGGHKGYGLGLINEIYSAFIGGSLPTLRGRDGGPENEKKGSTFFFQVIHPEAIQGHNFAQGRSQIENIRTVLRDVLGPGNENCLLPGQPEARNGELSKKNGGLLFTKAEIDEFNHIAARVNEPLWNLAEFKSVQI
jgi:L-2-hydroxycarboxylate dehydrogenase (NAD+)